MGNKYSVFSLIKNALSYHENWQRAWKDPSPKKEYDAVIVGGGGHGLATAYYLAKKHNMKILPLLKKDGLVEETLVVTLQLLDRIIYGTLVLDFMITR